MTFPAPVPEPIAAPDPAVAVAPAAPAPGYAPAATATGTSMRQYLEADQAPDVGVEAAAAVAVQHVPDDAVDEAEPTGFDPENARLTENLPADVAMLCVTETEWAGKPSFKLHFHYRGRVRCTVAAADLNAQRPRSVSIAELVDRAGDGRSPGEGSWREAYYDVMSGWAPMATLVEWVRELLDAEGDPQLVVWDNTGFEIPWELFRHTIALDDDDPGHDDGWLGELIPVIRWTTVHDGANAGRYTATSRESRGGVLMYEDPALAVEPAEADLFRRFEVAERRTTMAQLIRQLNDTSVAFGLVIVRCHGTYSAEERRMKLGGMPLNEFSDVRMRALRKYRAPVLLNACVTARPVGVVPRSFAELFLRYGAGAVIATVAEVGLNHSHEFAVRLLEEAEFGEVNIARTLLDHRRHYAERVRRAFDADEDPRTEEDFKLFFHSFMYVYFGHPGTTLRAIPREGGGAHDG
ncbi:hypothetical protein OG216_08035 [Streptomycetaceae bacterium NBC_01309]